LLLLVKSIYLNNIKKLRMGYKNIKNSILIGDKPQPIFKFCYNIYQIIFDYQNNHLFV
jgi:hypothetical protein